MQTRIAALGFSCILLASASLVGQPVESSTPDGRLAAIQAEVAKAERDFRDAQSKQPNPDVNDPEVEKLFQAFLAQQRKGFAESLEIAKADPTSATAYRALEWLLATPQAYYVDSFPAALKLLTEYHSDKAEIGKSVAVLAYYPPLENEAGYQAAVMLLQAVVKKNPDRTVRGQAALGLAWLTKYKFKDAEYNKIDSADRLASEAEREFEAVLREYGDCKNLRSRGARSATATLGGEAETELNELRNLRIGKLAPEITAEDLAGKQFRLTDYRGKVVLLAFWATWCGPCMASVPHERELCERFRNRPFVLIGVNGDDSRQAALDVAKGHEIPWRSFWNGKEGASGPIAMAWNVRGWPTVYVIDHQGIIREKNRHGEQLDDCLEKLITEAERDKVPKGQ